MNRKGRKTLEEAGKQEVKHMAELQKCEGTYFVTRRVNQKRYDSRMGTKVD